MGSSVYDQSQVLFLLHSQDLLTLMAQQLLLLASKLLSGWPQSCVHCQQGTDDLEEAMSERLQELPPPLGRHHSSSKQDCDGGFSFPQDMDTDAAGPSKVSHAQAQQHAVPESHCVDTAAGACHVIKEHNEEGPACGLHYTLGYGSLIAGEVIICGMQMEAEFQRASPMVDDWELEPSEIAFQEKIASGAFGDLYKGAYCGQDVAIKIVRNVQDNTQQFQEFIQASLHFEAVTNLQSHAIISLPSKLWEHVNGVLYPSCHNCSACVEAHCCPLHGCTFHFGCLFFRR